MTPTRWPGLIEPASVDLVLCHAVLEVVDDPAPVVSALAGVLRPGGAADPVGSAGERDTLRRRFDVEGAAALLTAAGLTVEEIHGVRVLADLLPAAVADGQAAALVELGRGRSPRDHPGGTSRPSCTCSPAVRHDRRDRPLGWYQIPTAAPYAPTLTGLTAASGRPLTSGFPSTTPTSLVTLGTGVAPGAHGVLGFTVCLPGTERVLNHIEWRDGDPDPLRWQPVPTQLERARAAGVAVTVVSRPEFGGTGLTLAANRGGDYRGAAGVDAVAATTLAALTAGPGPTLVSAYHPDVDRHGHLSGVDSLPWRVAVTEMDGLLARLVDGLPPDAALLVTADHGQLDIPAGDRFDLDTNPRLTAGVRVVAGEPRVRYLHVAPGATADVVAAWSAVLGTAARVLTREEAVASGRFGPWPPATWTGSATSWWSATTRTPCWPVGRSRRWCPGWWPSTVRTPRPR